MSDTIAKTARVTKTGTKLWTHVVDQLRFANVYAFATIYDASQLALTQRVSSKTLVVVCGQRETLELDGRSRDNLPLHVDAFLASIAKLAPHVTKLIVREADQVLGKAPDHWHLLLQRLPRLQVVHIETAEPTGGGHLQALLTHCPRLRELHVRLDGGQASHYVVWMGTNEAKWGCHPITPAILTLFV
jgi:hypothetical protein